jgi:hypothetical protein
VRLSAMILAKSSVYLLESGGSTLAR